MKQIMLTRNKLAMVDDTDYERLSVFAWQAVPLRHTMYAMRTSADKKTIYMHREILGITDSTIHVDHINHDGLDNRRDNLRAGYRGLNQRNQQKQQRPTTSKYKGVTCRVQRRQTKWIAQIKCDRKHRYLGIFTSEDDAARAYNRAAKEMFGEYALLNLLEQ